jgi:hypothetical protein
MYENATAFTAYTAYLRTLAASRQCRATSIVASLLPMPMQYSIIKLLTPRELYHYDATSFDSVTDWRSRPFKRLKKDQLWHEYLRMSVAKLLIPDIRAFFIVGLQSCYKGAHSYKLKVLLQMTGCEQTCYYCDNTSTCLRARSEMLTPWTHGDAWWMINVTDAPILPSPSPLINNTAFLCLFEECMRVVGCRCTYNNRIRDPFWRVNHFFRALRELKNSGGFWARHAITECARAFAALITEHTLARNIESCRAALDASRLFSFSWGF